MKYLLYIGWEEPIARRLEAGEIVSLEDLEVVEFNTKEERQAYIDGANSANGWDSPHWAVGEQVSITGNKLVVLDGEVIVEEPAKESLYPELDKMQSVQHDSQIIGEFLERMEAKGIILCQVKQAGNNGKLPYIFEDSGEPATLEDVMNHKAIHNPEYDAWRDGNYNLNTPMENLLAEYFGIDLKKANKEKEALLDSLRK